MKKLTTIFVISIREWKVFFHTPFAVMIVPLYLVLCGTFFYSKLDRYLTLARPNETLQSVAGLSIMTHLLVPFFQDLINIFVLIVPLMTMRSFSEEKKMGTYDLLVSYPLEPWQILLGKYLGVVTLILSLLAVSLVFPAFVAWKGEPYLPQIMTSYLGLVLFLVLYAAVGVVGSLLTENQIVAAMIAYGFFFLAVLLQWLAYISVAPWDRFFANFLFFAHLESFRGGLVYLGDLAVYLCTTLLVLLGCYWRLRRHFVR